MGGWCGSMIVCFLGVGVERAGMKVSFIFDVWTMIHSSGWVSLVEEVVARREGVEALAAPLVLLGGGGVPWIYINVNTNSYT